jgi:AcrR family transcriptional regulator
MIEDAALTIFAVRGYSDTRVEEIAAAADVTKQLLYRHFPSKKALFLALLDKHRNELLGALTADLSAPAEPEQRLEHALDRWLAYIHAQPQAAQLLFRDTTGDPEIQLVYRKMQADARATVAASIARRQPDIDPNLLEPAAELIRAGSTGLALWWTEHLDIPQPTILNLMLETYILGQLPHDEHPPPRTGVSPR